MATKVVTFRLPEDLIEAITLQANASSRCKTAVVVEALKQVLIAPTNTTPALLAGLQQQQEELQKKVASLNQQLVESTSEELSYSNTRYVDELNQVAAISQPLLESDGVNGGRRDGFDVALQQLAVKVEQRAKMLEQVLSACVDHVCMYDRLGRYTYANRAFLQSFSLEQTELYGKTWQQIGLPFNPMKAFDGKLQIALTTGQSIAEEMTLPTVNGLRDYEYILSPIHGVDGSVESVVYTARDITERKQAESSLRESEKNYRNLFEWASDSIFITDSSTHHLLDVNEHAARRLGYTRKQLLHLPAEVISPPMDLEHRAETLRQLWKTGTVTFEHVHKCKDGAQMPVEVSSRVVEYGGQLAIQSFVRDITERKEAQLKATLYQETLTNLEEAIAITDLEGCYLEQNRTHRLLLGYSNDELAELTTAQLVGTEVFATIKQALLDHHSYRGEIRSRTKSGKLLQLELSMFAVCNKAGEPVWYVASLRDISRNR
jgi:PAS domain S-box-containing protein